MISLFCIRKTFLYKSQSLYWNRCDCTKIDRWTRIKREGLRRLHYCEMMTNVSVEGDQFSLRRKPPKRRPSDRNSAV